MGCLESAFGGSRRVCSFGETITLSDRKPWNLNFLLGEPCDGLANAAKAWLSLDNQAGYPDTGDH